MEQNKKEETIQTIASLASNRYTATLNNKLNNIDREMRRSAEAINVLGLLKVAIQLFDSHADEIKAEQAARINGLFDYISTNENIKGFRINRNMNIMMISLQFKEFVINDPNAIKCLCERYPHDIPSNGDFSAAYRQNPDEAIKNYELYYKDGSFEVALQVNPLNYWYSDFDNIWYGELNPARDERLDENRFDVLKDKINSLTRHYDNTSEHNVVRDFLNSPAVSLVTGETSFRFTLCDNIVEYAFQNFEKYQELAEAPLTTIIDTVCNLNNINLINSRDFRRVFRNIHTRKKGKDKNANN